MESGAHHRVRQQALVSPSKHGVIELAERLRDRSAHIAVLGLGYAGLPIAVELALAGFSVTGLDVDDERVRWVNQGKSPVSNVAHADIAALILIGKRKLRATDRFGVLAEADCAIICVPTPLTEGRTADLRFVEAAAHSIASELHPGTLVILQSTCPPGTTRRVILPILEEGSGLIVGGDFFLAFAPERIDPGNRQYDVCNTPKLVGGITPLCSELASSFLGSIVERIVVVASPEVAEMAKLVENTFRFINISFANEMALLCDRMGVSVWDVIEAASTKPFGFMPHYPGPGVGGHCIPVVPFFLEAAARGHGMVSRLIEAAGRVNEDMPEFVVSKLERLLAARGKRLRGSRVLVLGVAYKANLSDTRESPSLRVLQMLVDREAEVSFFDPHVPQVSCGGADLTSLSAQEACLGQFDCAVLLTAHSDVDHEDVARRVDLFFDTRNYLAASKATSVVRM